MTSYLSSLSQWCEETRRKGLCGKIPSHLDDESLDVFVVAQGEAEGAARLHIVHVVVRLGFRV
jgi:hypothetical protein